MDKKPPKGKYGNWIKNFGKSASYVGKDVLTSMTPNTSEMVFNVATDLSELRTTLRDLRRDKRTILKYLLGEDDNFSEYLSIGLKNAKDSLKTGKIYDEEREEKLTSKAMGLDDSMMDFGDGGGFDDSFDDSFDEGDVSFSDETSKGPTKIVNMMGPSTGATVAVANEVNAANQSIVKGFQTSIESNIKATSMVVAINEKIAQSQLDALSKINDNVVNLVKFNNDSMSVFVQGSLKYYEDSMASFKIMQEALERMAPKEKEATTREYEEDPIRDITTGNFSIMNYAKAVARNAKNAFQNSPLGMITMLNDPTMLSMVAANPLSFLMSEGFQSLLPNSFKTSLGKVDSSIKNFIPAILNRIANDANKTGGEGGFFTSLLSEIFGVKSDNYGAAFNRRGANDFERGAIPYDGESKKAITEVIPSYLSKINYNLEVLVAYGEHQIDINPNDGADANEKKAIKAGLRAKGREIVYDWDKDSNTAGRFLTRQELVASRKKQETDTILNSTYDFKLGAMDKIRSVYGYDKADIGDIEKRLDNMIIDIVRGRADFNPEDAELFSKYFSGLKSVTQKDANGNEIDYTPQMIQNAIKNLSNDTLLGMAGSTIAEARYAIKDRNQKMADEGGTRVTNMDTLMSRGNIFDIGGENKQYWKEGSFVTKNEETGYFDITEDDKKKFKDKYNAQFSGDRYKDLRKEMNKLKTGEEFAKFYDEKIIPALKERQSGGMDSILTEINDEASKKTFRSEEERKAWIDEQMQAKMNDYYKNNQAQFDFKSESSNSAVESISKLFKSPFDYVSRGMDRLNKWMYDAVFGKDSIFDNVVKGIKGTFESVKTWLTQNIFEPIKNRFFKNGFDKAGEMASNIFLGDKDKDGKYSGGMFSDVLNGASDFGDTIKTEWNNWFLPSVKEWGNTVKEHIFGKSDDNKPKKPLMDSIMDGIGQGFSEWTSMFFGGTGKDKKENEANAKLAMDKFRSALPDIGKGVIAGAGVGIASGLGGFGVLGSLFLPGGPIGGALVGGALGLLHKSDRFKDWLYGKEETNADGTKSRAGGIISKKMQDFFKKNKTAMIGGATLGVAKTALLGGGIGLIPSMAVGFAGPVLAGAAWGMLSKSETLQNALFGKADPSKDGQKVGGLMNSKFMGTLKKSLPRIAVGAAGSVAGFTVLGNMGLLGSMLALGPMNAAIVGGALGLATASDKFRDYFFGSEENGVHKPGALQKLSNKLTAEAFKPFSLYIEEKMVKSKKWFELNIALPVADALLPLKIQAKKIGTSILDSLNNMFSGVKKDFSVVFDKIKSGVTTLFSAVLKPVKTVGKAAVSTAGFVTRNAMKLAIAPLTIAGGIASGSLKKDAYLKNIKNKTGGFKGALKNGNLGDIIGSAGGMVESLWDFQGAYANDKWANELVQGQKANKEKRKKLRSEYDDIKTYYKDKWSDLEQEQEFLRNNKYSMTRDEYEKKKKELEDKLATKEGMQKLTEDAKANPMAAGQLEQISESQKTNEILTKIEQHTSESLTAQQDMLVEMSPESEAAKQIKVKKELDNTAAGGKMLDEEKAKAEEEKEYRETIIEKLNTLEGIARPKKEKKPNKLMGFFSSLASGGLTFLKGLLGLGTSITGILGTAGGLATALSMLFGSNETKKAIVESNAFGNVATRGMRAGVRGGVYAGTQLIPALGRTLFGKGEIEKEFVDKYGNKIVKTVTDKGLLGGTASDLMKKASDFGTNTKNYLFGTGKDYFVYDRVNGQEIRYKKTDRGLIGNTKLGKGLTKAGDLAKSAGNLISKKVTDVSKTSVGSKLVDGAMAAVTKLVDGTDWLKGKGKKVIDCIKGLFELFSKNETIRKHVMVKAGKATMRVGAASVTLGLATLAFGAYDGISGMIDASQMFDVADDDVDFKMRLIAGFVNTLFGLPGMGYIDIMLSLASTGLIALGATSFGKMLSQFGLNIKGFDHRKIVCQWLYRLISDEEDNAKLDENQKKLVDEYEKYKKEHQQPDLTFEQWNAEHGNGKSMWQKYGAPVFNRIFGIKDSDKPKSLMERIGDAYDGFVDWIKTAFKNIMKWTPFGFIKGLLGFGDPDEAIDTKSNTFNFEGLGSYVNKKIKGFFSKDNDESDSSSTDDSNYIGGTDISKFVGDGYGEVKDKAKRLSNETGSIAGKFNSLMKMVQRQSSSVGNSFTGGGAPSESKTITNGEEQDTLNRYWTQTDPALADLPVAPNADKYFGTFKDFGCAPTSMAMIASQYNNTEIDPIKASEYITKEDLSYGDGLFGNTVKGIKPSYFVHTAEDFNLQVNDKNGAGASITDALQAGNMVVLGARRGITEDPESTPFTRTGHYVVLGGISKDGTMGYVYDPLGRSGAYNLEALYDDALTTVGDAGYAASFEPAFGRPKKADKAAAKAKQKKVEGEAIVKRARDYFGTPYDLSSFGGKPGVPTSCAKFVTDVYADCGIDLANNSAYVPDVYNFLLAHDAIVPPDYTPNPGDIVIWNRSIESNGQGGDCAHIGICTGVGKRFIHASFSRGVVEDPDYTTSLGSTFSVKCFARFDKLPGTAKYTGPGDKSGNRSFSNKVFDNPFMKLISSFGEVIPSVLGSIFSGKVWTPSMLEGEAATSSGGSGANSSTTKPTYDTKDTAKNKKFIWDWLHKKGWNDAQAAGIMGNIQQESNFNPHADEGKPVGVGSPSLEESTGGIDGTGDTGYGLMQWTYYSRRRGLKEFADSVNRSTGDLGTQLDYFWKEYNNYGSFDEINKMNDPIQVAKVFGKDYEGHGVEGNRLQYASEIYNTFAGSGPDQIAAEALGPAKIDKKQLKAQYDAEKSALFKSYGVSIDDYNEIKRQLNKASDKYSKSNPELYAKQKEAILSAYGIDVKSWDELNNAHYALRKSDKYKSLNEKAVSKPRGLFGKLGTRKLFGHSKAYEALKNMNQTSAPINTVPNEAVKVVTPTKPESMVQTIKESAKLTTPSGNILDKKSLKNAYMNEKQALFAKYNINIDDYDEIKRQLNKSSDKYAKSNPELYNKQKVAILSAYNIKPDVWDKLNNEYYSLRKSDKYKSLGEKAVSKSKGLFGKLGTRKLFGHSKAYEALKNIDKPKTASPAPVEQNKQPITTATIPVVKPPVAETVKTTASEAIAKIQQDAQKIRSRAALPNASETNKIISGGPMQTTPINNSDLQMAELIKSVKALDIHSELAEAVAYLKYIAENGGKVTPTAASMNKVKSAINRAKNQADNQIPNISNPEIGTKLDSIMKAHNYVNESSGDALLLAYRTAAGGNFRNR